MAIYEFEVKLKVRVNDATFEAWQMEDDNVLNRECAVENFILDEVNSPTMGVYFVEAREGDVIEVQDDKEKQDEKADTSRETRVT